MTTTEHIFKKYCEPNGIELSNRVEMPSEVMNRKELANLYHDLNFTEGAEVGVAQGYNAGVIMRANPQLHLRLIDPWRRYSGHKRGRKSSEQIQWYENLQVKMAPYNVTFMKMLSMDAMRDIPVNSLDFVYIDGHHIFDYVIQDIVEWTKRVRPGGIVAGHDYYPYQDRSMRREQSGVVEAVDAYVDAHRIPHLFLTDSETDKPSWLFEKSWN